jgi:hypothetical protein
LDLGRDVGEGSCSCMDGLAHMIHVIHDGSLKNC